MLRTSQSIGHRVHAQSLRLVVGSAALSGRQGREEMTTWMPWSVAVYQQIQAHTLLPAG